MQARKLKGLLQSMKLGPKALWVSSPLARAMQTMVLACPQAELLGRNTADQGFRTAIRGYDPRLGHCLSWWAVPVDCQLCGSRVPCVGRRELPVKMCWEDWCGNRTPCVDGGGHPVAFVGEVG